MFFCAPLDLQIIAYGRTTFYFTPKYLHIYTGKLENLQRFHYKVCKVPHQLGCLREAFECVLN